jgi:hypothetical protein
MIVALLMSSCLLLFVVSLVEPQGLTFHKIAAAVTA